MFSVSRSLFMCVVLGVGTYLSAPLTALAQSESVSEIKRYSVTAGALEDVLNQFALQAGITLTFSPQLVAGKTSSGLQGDYSLESGLTVLLTDTGLSPVSNDGKVYILVKANVVSDANTRGVMLGPVRVQGATSASDEVYQTAGSVNVITREKIERFRGTSVGDIFQGTAGVLIGENRNSGGLDVNIRGMQGQGRVPILVDGARQETTVYRGYAGVAGRSYVDPDLIGSVHIEKGPVMSAEGTGAVGGVVSMHTISAADIVKDGKDWGVRVRGSLLGNNSGEPPAPGTRGGFSSWSDDGIYRTDCARPDICNQMHPNGKRSYALMDNFASDEGMDRPDLLEFKSHAASIAATKRFAWGDIVVAYAERNQGNYYAGKKGDGAYIELNEVSRNLLFTEVKATIHGASRFRAEERIINSNNESQSWLLKTQLYLPEDQIWELSYLRYDSTYGELMPSQLLWFGAIEQTKGSDVLAQTYTSRYQWDPADNEWVNVKFNLWHTDTDNTNSNYSEAAYATGVAPPTQTELYSRWGGDLSNTFSFNKFGATQLRFGIAAQQENVRPENRALNDEIGGWGTLRDGSRDEYSAFTSVQYKPFSQLTFDAGIRYTRFDSEDHRAVTILEDSQFCIDNDEDGYCDRRYHKNSSSGSAPIISLTYEPWQGVQFYARYAEALRMPSLFEGSGGASVTPSFEIGLRPEHAHNREFGFNYFQHDALLSSDKLGFKLAYFHNHITDYLTRTNSNNWETDSSGAAGVMRNINSADFHGWELNLDYDANWFFANISATRYTEIAICHYGSFRRYECTDYGLASSYINNMIPPPYHGSATLGTRLFKQKLELGLRSTWMGKRSSPEYNNDANRGFNLIVPWHSYELLDVFASWHSNDTLTVDFNIDNLTDQYYLDALSLGLVPAPGRTARLGITLQF